MDDAIPNGGTITNLTKRDVTGTKVWDDGQTAITHNNASEITLTLFRLSTKPFSVEEQVRGVSPVWSGNEYRFSNLPVYDMDGYEYIYYVREAAIQGYTIRYSNEALAFDGNHYNEAALHGGEIANIRDDVQLHIYKTVQGSLGNTERDRTFTLWVEGFGGKSVGAEKQSPTASAASAVSLAFNSAATAQFTLKDAESITISLPRGVKYSVSETAYGSYETEWKVFSIGTTTEFTAGNSTGVQTLNPVSSDGQSEVALETIQFNNTLDVSPPTGVFDSIAPAIILLVLLGAMIVLGASFRERTEHHA